jgi:hypothetical protein
LKRMLPLPCSRCSQHHSRAISDTTQCRYTGAFFPKAMHFVVAGGKFKSITHVHQAAPIAPPGQLEHIRSTEILTFGTDFRLIPLGDLNLLQEIGIHCGANVVHRKNGGNSVRRMYSARVHGCKANMTVALYQGSGAEDVCFLFC